MYSRLKPSLWKFHRTLALILLLPSFVIFGSGLLLQWREHLTWVQPKQFIGSSKIPNLSLETILQTAQSMEGSEVRSWNDISSVDIRPSKGVIRLRTHSHFEIQLDAGNGKILGSGMRRRSWITELHEGAWFGKSLRNIIFLPSSILLCLLWLSGSVLLYGRIISKVTIPKKETLYAPST